MQHAPEQTAGAAHTPGPWEVVEATEHHGFYVTSQFGNTICDLYTMSRPDMPATVNGGPSKPVPFLAGMDGPNAHLTAAAPELLEALAWFISDIDGTLTRMVDFDANVERARAAIAKARGQ